VKTRSIRGTCIFVATLLILAFCRSMPAFAASMVTISPSGNGVFTVQGTGVDGAAALEITVTYDMATLADPRVVAGPLIAGAMTAFNPNVPGTVRMVIIRLTPMSGSGVIATLTFDCKGSSPGKILSLSARVANAQGTPLPALVQVNNPPDAATTASDPSQGREFTSGRADTTQQKIAPAIILAGQPDKPGEPKAAPDAQEVKDPGDGSVLPEPGRGEREEPTIMARKADPVPMNGEATAAAQASEPTIFMHKSVLDRFKEYNGGRTPDAMVSLFDQNGIFWCRQDPPVALSDGKTVVRITFVSTPGNKTLSDIAIMGARLISLKPYSGNTNTWVAELLPEKGAYRASLTVLQGEVRMVYPLTIAPKTAPGGPQSGGITKAELARYFAGRGPARSTRSDADHDAKYDYLDDYIMTANYLAAVGPAQKQARTQ
jgi:hypothetical protein